MATRHTQLEALVIIDKHEERADKQAEVVPPDEGSLVDDLLAEERESRAKGSRSEVVEALKTLRRAALN